ncbi:hypothetical protein CEUSTIGMA_g6509.t1 [Chlamydomonas eustigma]|uniref:FIST domain-containing protein n=1 Tax=Chlamydomonas eustigma TaxID=1157962 RepID=A0A250X816_9CHLO|nr:hypothetical protein CEUSTIGMA_g6509.t1 [Chlamydomonas eustigma]|eukprot:GAX79069.1 hypothetical protein CEUSTIGMA_g6509.t1 [Chlamydomonas eustigma]
MHVRLLNPTRTLACQGKLHYPRRFLIIRASGGGETDVLQTLSTGSIVRTQTSEIRWGSFVSTLPVIEIAAQEAVEGIMSSVGKDTKPDLAIVFVTCSLGSEFDKVIPILRKLVPSLKTIVGCSGYGVVGGGVSGPREIEGEPGFSLTLGQLPGVDMHVVHTLRSGIPEQSVSRQEWSDFVGVPYDSPREVSFMILSHPRFSQVEAVVAGLDYAFPDSKKIGGVLSTNDRPRARALFAWNCPEVLKQLQSSKQGGGKKRKSGRGRLSSSAGLRMGDGRGGAAAAAALRRTMLASNGMSIMSSSVVGEGTTSSSDDEVVQEATSADPSITSSSLRPPALLVKDDSAQVPPLDTSNSINSSNDKPRDETKPSTLTSSESVTSTSSPPSSSATVSPREPSKESSKSSGGGLLGSLINMFKGSFGKSSSSAAGTDNGAVYAASTSSSSRNTADSDANSDAADNGRNKGNMFSDAGNGMVTWLASKSNGGGGGGGFMPRDRKSSSFAGNVEVSQNGEEEVMEAAGGSGTYLHGAVVLVMHGDVVMDTITSMGYRATSPLLYKIESLNRYNEIVTISPELLDGSNNILGPQPPRTGKQGPTLRLVSISNAADDDSNDDSDDEDDGISGREVSLTGETVAMQAILDMLESHESLESVDLDEMIQNSMLSVARDSGKASADLTADDFELMPLECIDEGTGMLVTSGRLKKGDRFRIMIQDVRALREELREKVLSYKRKDLQAMLSGTAPQQPTFGVLMFTDMERGLSLYEEENYEAKTLSTYLPAPTSGLFGGAQIGQFNEGHTVMENACVAGILRAAAPKKPRSAAAAVAATSSTTRLLGSSRRRAAAAATASSTTAAEDGGGSEEIDEADDDENEQDVSSSNNVAVVRNENSNSNGAAKGSTSTMHDESNVTASSGNNLLKKDQHHDKDEGTSNGSSSSSL